MHITQAELTLFAPAAIAMLDGINQTIDRYEIDTPKRLCAFLAQTAHESGGFHYMREIWGPTPAQVRYEGRLDLGNTRPGDGVKFKGRGLIQITGRSNYSICSTALYGDARLLTTPELLEHLPGAVLSAGWFWDSHRLNLLADVGNFTRITQQINGGLNGFDDRQAWLAKAQRIWK